MFDLAKLRDRLRVTLAIRLPTGLKILENHKGASTESNESNSPIQQQQNVLVRPSLLMEYNYSVLSLGVVHIRWLNNQRYVYNIREIF